MSCDVMSRHVMSVSCLCHVMSCHVASGAVARRWTAADGYAADVM